MPRRCALGCPPNYNVTTHKFPHPIRNPEVFKSWVRAIGGQLENPTDYKKYVNKILCDIHFTHKDMNRNKRLNAKAVPTLHVNAVTPRASSPIMNMEFCEQPVAKSKHSVSDFGATSVVSSNNLKSEHDYCSGIKKSVRRLVSREWPRKLTTMGDKRFKVYVTRSDMPASGVELLKKECDVEIYEKPSPVPREDFLRAVPGINGIYCSLTDKIDKELLDAAGPSLKVVATISVGHDHINVDECKKRGIRIGYTPDVLTDATAELTMALLLSTSRRLPEAIHEAKTGGWVSWAPTWMTGPGLAGATVGIVGFGRIGQAVARRVKSFNTGKILYYNRSVRTEAKEIGATKVTFDELLIQSDFIICCAALVPETKEIFNKAAFAKMKPTAIFINTSRGGTVDQDALIEALQNNTIRAAGLDVTTPEPLPLDSPLFKLKNCVVLPHIGSASIEARNTMSELTAYNILGALGNRDMPAELI